MIYRIQDTFSRAATMENPRGLPGMGGMSGGGRKASPALSPFCAGTTHTLLETEGPGVIRHIWITVPPGDPLVMRNLILRMYWDNSPHPSVEAPLLDFFGNCHGRARHTIGELLYVQDGRGLNCWFPMPFCAHARIELENDSGKDVKLLFYQVDYSLGDEIGKDDGYFHAQFRRSNPCPMGQDYVICDIEGRGQYVGTVLGVRSLYKGAWWGEGEVKAYIDSDEKYPTICGTGTEDYMGSAWGLDQTCTPLQGAPLVDNEAGLYSLYRFHTMDPIRFSRSLRLSVQQIGYGDRERARAHFGASFSDMPACGNPPDGPNCYFERSDDYCSVAYWYQRPVHPRFAPLPDRAARSRDLLEQTARDEVIRRDI